MIKPEQTMQPWLASIRPSEQSYARLAGHLHSNLGQDNSAALETLSQAVLPINALKCVCAVWTAWPSHLQLLSLQESGHCRMHESTSATHRPERFGSHIVSPRCYFFKALIVSARLLVAVHAERVVQNLLCMPWSSSDRKKVQVHKFKSRINKSALYGHLPWIYLSPGAPRCCTGLTRPEESQ